MEIIKLHKLLIECDYKISTDTRKITRKSIFFSLKGKNFNGNHFANNAIKKGASYVVIDDKIEKKYDENLYIKVDNSLETLQNLAKYNRLQSNAKIIALTGSNGKTTTKELIKSVLEAKYNTISTYGNLNNNIGVPLTLLRIKPETQVAIIEMGANNLGEINFLTKLINPDYGYITNFGKAHLEGFKNIKGVIKGKTELYDWIIESGKILIINSDDQVQQNI